MKILLISNSFSYGGGYLDHYIGEIQTFLSNVNRVLFIHYALKNWSEYYNMTKKRFVEIDKKIEPIHVFNDISGAIKESQAILVGGGNTFRLLKILYDFDLLKLIKTKVQGGTPYIGISAGANIACPTIKTTNDMPIVFPNSLHALNLVPFQINSHYISADPNSKHMGETRDERIKEYHEENDLPVLGIREGSLVSIQDNNIILRGKTGAKLFLKGKEPKEIKHNAQLDYLWYNKKTG